MTSGVVPSSCAFATPPGQQHQLEQTGVQNHFELPDISLPLLNLPESIGSSTLHSLRTDSTLSSCACSTGSNSTPFGTTVIAEIKTSRNNTKSKILFITVFLCFPTSSLYLLFLHYSHSLTNFI
jgi:hypothetical protein